MRLQMPISHRKVQNHLQYGLWKYLLLIVIALAGWNLLYTTTRYQSPDNLKVEFYAQSSGTEVYDLQTLADQIHEEIMPEMEEVSTNLVTYDDTYGDMQLMVWVSAAQGDVYLLTNEKFESLASNEGLMDLQPFIDSGALDVTGLDLTDGYVKNEETGEVKLVGIPTAQLPKLADYGTLTTDAALCVLASNGNDEYSIKFLNYLLTHMQADPVAE